MIDRLKTRVVAVDGSVDVVVTAAVFSVGIVILL